MHIGLLQIGGLLGTVTNLQGAGLVIGAVGAGDKFLVLLLEGEPSLQVVLLRSGVVESTRDNGDNLVGKTQGLVELLGGVHHVLKRLPRVLGLSKDELLDLERMSIGVAWGLGGLKPSRTGGHGRYPRHPCREIQPPCGNMCCIRHT